MRNTLQEQYNLLKEGKGNKQHFFKSARHLFPDLVTPVNTFEDTVRILKNRGIITEGRKERTKELLKKINIHLGGTLGKSLRLKRLSMNRDISNILNLLDAAIHDYKDYKNIDNIFGEAFLKGFYTEMSDPKNEGKTVEELRQIVAKNMAKDCLHYTKVGQFGLKGVGYTVDAPGLGETKPAKGKHKSSGYGDLKESVLRSQIYLLVKEVLAESLTPADKMAFSQAVDFAEDLYDKVGNVEDVLANLPKQFIQYKDELEQHLTQKFEG